MDERNSPTDSEVDRQNSANKSRNDEIHIGQADRFKAAEKESIADHLSVRIGRDDEEVVQGKKRPALQIPWPEVKEPFQFRWHFKVWSAC